MLDRKTCIACAKERPPDRIFFSQGSSHSDCRFDGFAKSSHGSLLGTGLFLLFPPGLLHTILGVLLGTSSRSSLLTSQASALQTILGLELLQLLQVLIDQAKTTAASTSKSCFEAEELDALDVMDLVHTAQLLSQVLLGDVGHARMDHIQDELLAAQQGVVLELSGANCELTHGCAFVFTFKSYWRSLLPEFEPRQSEQASIATRLLLEAGSLSHSLAVLCAAATPSIQDPGSSGANKHLT